LAHYPSDEEQIEALKRWWNENGSSLIVGVVIALVVLFGSRQWQGSRQGEAENASEIYDGIVEQVAVGAQTGDMSAEALNALEASYDALRNDYADSIYSRYAALMLASVYVQQENYDQAAAELRWVMENQELGFMRSAEPELFLTARLRLARVLLAQNKAEEALDLVTAVDPGSLAAGYAEAQGDAYAQLGQNEQARGAYQRSIDLQPDNLGFVELKLLGVNG